MNLKKAINTTAKFLALRHIEELTKNSLLKFCGTETADIIMVFGNDLPAVAEIACRAYLDGFAKKIMFCGGVGHSTQILKDTLMKFPQYAECDLSGAEGDIFSEIAKKIFSIPAENILVENRSTNCGENGAFALKILREKKFSHHTIILMQDPIMQYRSYLSTKKLLDEKNILISYAPFVPQVDENLKIVSRETNLWSNSRFYSLLMGEIRRLRDDENGYGPKGTGFIPHVDIPPEVETADKILRHELQNYLTR